MLHVLLKLFMEGRNRGIFVKASSVKCDHDLSFGVPCLQLELICRSDAERQVKFSNESRISRQQLKVFGDWVRVHLIFLLDFTELFVHFNELRSVFDLIGVFRISNIDAVKILVELRDYQIAFADILHEHLVWLEHELLAAFQLLVH